MGPSPGCRRTGRAPWCSISVTFDSSTRPGLRAVIAAHRDAERKGQELALIRGPEQVQQVFEITGLARRLRIVSDESQVVPASHRDDPQA
jgi:anti-anti-sigma regulatory factor